MPVYRGGPSHAEAARALREGKLPVSPVNDTSVLWRQDQEEVLFGGGITFGEYLVVGYSPFAALYFCLGFGSLILAITFILLFTAIGSGVILLLGLGFAALVYPFIMWGH
ncbi:hypothetical protein [Alkalilimnicola ehrlichii]|uniref:Uncharacterized protein n=1 Tax=Alkalilimnicola ehrlichii TaxID=351052 RepID=A0A3E0WVP2_9GAMM|nr:hypothetical protein [Alkalilimnicola ehrlichii]RFA36469.1 hypothetical protein CAL65_10850 [Alkalilimnicola ehrlichii]